MLRSGLKLYPYSLPPGTPPNIGQYPAIDNLQFSTVAPGGFGEIHFRVYVPDVRMPQPSLALFARVALMAHGEASGATGPVRAAFLGEISEPIPTSDATGDYIQVHGLGLGNSLRDDPLSVAYNSQTALQIIKDQLSGYNRPNFLPIDQDTSMVFPDNPVATFAPVYDGNTIEEVLQDVCVLAGDYHWFVWGHAKNTDAASFPTGQLVVQKRDTTTTHYQARALEGDLISYKVTPQAERAYNVIKIGYNAGNAGYGVATYTDPRLGAGGDQHNAPFRRRVFQRDYSNISTIGSTQAQSIANTYGALFQNAPSKVELVLKAVRDANGNPIPPWEVQAGRNILVPELAVRGNPFASAPTPGVNQFYILQTSYQEDASGWTLTLTCDNFVDTAELQVARLQLQADLKQRGGKVIGVYQRQGAAETGNCGVTQVATAGGQTFGQGVNFRALMAQVPSSVTLASNSSVNVASTSVTRILIQGFHLNVVSNAAGALSWTGTYTTVGNTLHRVGTADLDWHCAGCDTLHSSIPHARLTVHRGHPESTHYGQPGETGLAVVCPACGFVESFNTALTSADEQERDGGGRLTHRAGQARLIRALMRAPAVGLETLETLETAP